MSEPVSVLLIEDNPGDARLVGEALTGPDATAFHLVCAQRLSEGLDQLTRGGFDVVLLDLGLPDSQGLPTLSSVRAAAPHVPVVVLSGTGDDQFAVDAMQAGAQDYLVKHYVNRHSLTRSLRYAIERMHLEERLRLAMSAANESIWEYDPGTGAVVWNETYARNFGRPSDGASSTQWWVEHIHGDDAGRVTASLERALHGSGDSWVAEYRMLRPGGYWADVHDRAIISRDPLGRPIRVVGAMLDITERKRAEEGLRIANDQLRQLSSDLLRTQDYERRRIARELHDSTAQLLAALSMQLVRLKKAGTGPVWEKTISEALALAAACSTEIRTVTYLLHPPLLDEIGLVSALQAYAHGFTQRTGIQVEVRVSPDFGRLSGEVEATVFRIIQEGLGNVHKHSGSQVAVIRLEREPGRLRLVLQDRGRGLPETLQSTRSGYVGFGVGVMGMRERAEQLGGQLELTSNEVGARLTVTLPLVQSHEENQSSVGR